jgi:hypothetical protein
LISGIGSGGGVSAGGEVPVADDPAEVGGGEDGEDDGLVDEETEGAVEGEIVGEGEDDDADAESVSSCDAPATSVGEVRASLGGASAREGSSTVSHRKRTGGTYS